MGPSGSSCRSKESPAADLLYRLRTIVVELPPLRERLGDVKLLAEHFIGRLNARYGFRRHIGAEVLALLQHHDWPGNVRELLHVIEAASVVCEGPQSCSSTCRPRCARRPTAPRRRQPATHRCPRYAISNASTSSAPSPPPTATAATRQRGQDPRDQ